MARHNVLRSGALRLAMLYAGMFAGVAILYVGTVHYMVQRYARTSLESSIDAEIALVRGEDETRGRAALLRRLRASRQFFYGLTDAKGARVAGTLASGPDEVGWHTVPISRAGTADDSEGEPEDVLTFGLRLADGSLLIVGRSLYASDELVEWLDQAAIWTAAGIVVLALGGGWLIASAFLRRLDRVNEAITRIMSGAFAERIPSIGMGAEFDMLAAQLNAMLDRILSLMEGHRQLSTTIAHDLRTPLSRVRQRLEMTRDGLTDSEARDAVDGVLLQLDDVLSTFAALLRLGTIETGTLRARFGPVELASLLSRIDAAFEPVAEDQDKALATSAMSEAVVAGDPELLGQLFTNVVENALLHTGRGTRISIELRTEGGHAVVAIADDGPGIPAAERSNVLRRFYRLDRAPPTSGAGLGLALVDAITVLHRGSLDLSDNGPGLRVTLRFPLLT